jgi:hypothetical protein
LVETYLSVLALLWYLLALPFRLFFWMVAWMGRMSAILLGFSLMVVGVALWAGHLYLIGIPVFLIGLVLALKSLG